jgi:hypothetical protein
VKRMIRIQFSDHEFSRHAHMWSGYMRAGAALIENCKRNTIDRSELIYPILYCYRHGLELVMKLIISRYWFYSEASFHKIEHHDLWKLWQFCRPIILLVDTSTEDGSIDGIEQIIEDFHQVDKGSFFISLLD